MRSTTSKRKPLPPSPPTLAPPSRGLTIARHGVTELGTPVAGSRSAPWNRTTTGWVGSLAWIGLTEEEARERHGEAVKVYRERFNPMYHAFTQHKRASAVKLVTV